MASTAIVPTDIIKLFERLIPSILAGIKSVITIRDEAESHL